jgi:hypothetical protein
MVELDFRAISSGQLSWGIAEPYQYNFISLEEVGKILIFCTGRNRITHELKTSGRTGARKIPMKKRSTKRPCMKGDMKKGRGLFSAPASGGKTMKKENYEET